MGTIINWFKTKAIKWFQHTIVENIDVDVETRAKVNLPRPGLILKVTVLFMGKTIHTRTIEKGLNDD